MCTIIILTLILLPVALATGHWLSLAGRPLKTLRFSLHKLISLACMALVIYLFWMGDEEFLPGTYMLYSLWGLIITASLTFVTGVLLSFDKLAVNALRFSHKWVAVLSLLICLTSGIILFIAISKG
jgi:hypothetical protein